MAIAINGSSNTITGVAVGGLPDGIVDTDMLAANAVTDAKENLSGTAKAWCSFNGEPSEAINDSFNISSFVDNGVGDFTFNFTNAMSSVNYCVATSSSRNGNAPIDCLSWSSVANKTTGAFTINVGQTNSGFSSTISASDLAEYVDFAVFGD